MAPVLPSSTAVAGRQDAPSAPPSPGPSLTECGRVFPLLPASLIYLVPTYHVGLGSALAA